ncbi:hypothetical protein KKD72_00950 [Patescibacteria group bacterium]|nr:hypothetical protein [Patescibacteria group bacterium]
MKKILQTVILVLLMAWYGLFFVHKIDLTTADLGRHIANGRLILSGQFDVLKTNFYSYTEPNFPVVNHHWGAGVIFHLIEKAFGFAGLSLFYLILSLVIFWLFFKIAQTEAGFWTSAMVSLLYIPLMAARTEIRPEIFSYLFIALFFWILWRWRRREISGKWLFVLPAIELIWANVHIYFIFGLALIGLFLFEEVIRPALRNIARIKKLGLVFLFSLLASLATPFFISGLLEPFRIFQNYGYLIVENQSVRFLENLGFIVNPNLKLFEIGLAVLILSFVFLLFKKKKPNLVFLILAAVFSVMGWLAIRNFTLFGLFTLPIVAGNLQDIFNNAIFKNLRVKIGLVFLSLAVFGLIFLAQFDRLSFGWGLSDGNSRSAEFFKEVGVRGPVFNNYDIGGYLIYELFPMEKVFIDNRPEAYSVDFFQSQYIPMQQDNSVWRQEDARYRFNAIFFSHRDATPWGQNFLIERLKDDLWAPVYVDQYALIFLKRNELNQEIIEKYGIPKESFFAAR